MPLNPKLNRFLSFSTLLFALPSFSYATLNESDYLDALKAAQKKVERARKVRAGNTLALSSPIVKKYFGRYYQVGDSWDVIASQIDNPMMRMTGDDAHLKPKKIRIGAFHYEVIEVKDGARPEVVIKVTQTEDFGLKPIDRRISYLTLTMGDHLVQSKKTYSIAGTGQLVPVSPDGGRSNFTLLELFPLDAPDVVTAESRKATSLPELPEELSARAKQAGFAPDLSRSSWIEQDDFFGRPVQMLWQQGDPWPSLIKTTNGYAILARKRTL